MGAEDLRNKFISIDTQRPLDGLGLEFGIHLYDLLC